MSAQRSSDGRALGLVLATAVRLTLVVGAGWVLAATQPTPKTLFVLVAWAMAAYRILTALSVKITDWLWA